MLILNLRVIYTRSLSLSFGRMLWIQKWNMSLTLAGFIFRHLSRFTIYSFCTALKNRSVS